MKKGTKWHSLVNSFPNLNGDDGDNEGNEISLLQLSFSFSDHKGIKEMLLKQKFFPTVTFVVKDAKPY